MQRYIFLATYTIVNVIFLVTFNYFNAFFLVKMYFAYFCITPKDIRPEFRCKKKREDGFAPRFFTEDLDAGGPIGVTSTSSFCVPSTPPIH